ncbi:unnamed protein product [Vicia faba]|uniref:Uncharacterized protein n=1 Tax=Vicia faba TaxID=3906 RepID=A0AAV0ZRD9_VICFA|nr:unnamed protein product [Vicia faba]
MTGFPENETKPALSLFSLTLYSSGSSFGLWLALASVFLSLGFLFCALEVTAFNLLLEWLSISIGVRPTDLPSTSMMMDASGAGGGPSQGVGQRLPGALERNSPGISGESIFRDFEQPGGEPAPKPEAAQPGQVPEGPLGEVFEKINTRLLFAASKKRGWQPPIDEIITLINLKSKVISRMAELDPDPFWVENRTSLLVWETPF